MNKLFFLLAQFQMFLLGYNDNSNFYDEMKNVGKTPVTTIESFNKWLMSFLGYAGAIIIAIAIIKLIIAMQQADANQKMQASLLMGLGTAFVVSDTIITAIDLKNNAADPAQIVKNIASTIGSLVKYVAIFLIAIALIQLILSYINQDSTQKVEAAKGMTIAFVLYFIQNTLITVADTALGITANTTSTMNDITAAVIAIILSTARFIGIILGIYGLINLIMALKDQDAGAIQQASTLLVVAIVLTMFKTILQTLGIYYEPTFKPSPGILPSGPQDIKTSGQIIIDTIKYFKA